jgi:hypothetical protein
MVFPGRGIDIIVITNNGQAVDLGQFTSLGIDPTRYRTVAVKSMQHFRAAFEPIARAVVGVDTGALCSEIYTPELFTQSPPPGLGPWTRSPIRAYPFPDEVALTTRHCARRLQALRIAPLQCTGCTIRLTRKRAEATSRNTPNPISRQRLGRACARRAPKGAV